MLMLKLTRMHYLTYTDHRSTAFDTDGQSYRIEACSKSKDLLIAFLEG